MGHVTPAQNMACGTTDFVVEVALVLEAMEAGGAGEESGGVDRELGGTGEELGEADMEPRGAREVLAGDGEESGGHGLQ